MILIHEEDSRYESLNRALVDSWVGNPGITFAKWCKKHGVTHLTEYVITAIGEYPATVYQLDSEEDILRVILTLT